MKITHLIAQNILQVYEGNNWTHVCIAETIKNMSVEQAMTVTSGSPNSIASLTHHLKYWNEIVMKRMDGDAPEVSAANGFDIDMLRNEDEWKRLIIATHESFMQISDALTNFPVENLFDITNNGKSTYYKNMQGIAEHAHYHLGQIIIIKKLSEGY